jgi:hypothetical protein
MLTPLILTAASLLIVTVTGCGDAPELTVPPREIRCWPSEQYAVAKAQPDERFFTITAMPPQVFFRPGADCGALENLQIQIAAWPPVGTALAADAPNTNSAIPAVPPADAGVPAVDAPATTQPPPQRVGASGAPARQFYVSDRHARPEAHFAPASAIEWEPKGGREVIEVRGTSAGQSPTPVTAVPFQPGWLYRLTILAKFTDQTAQRTIWLGPEARRSEALAADAGP